jgi:hypothetical protein
MNGKKVFKLNVGRTSGFGYGGFQAAKTRKAIGQAPGYGNAPKLLCGFAGRFPRPGAGAFHTPHRGDVPDTNQRHSASLVYF